MRFLLTVTLISSFLLSQAQTPSTSTSLSKLPPTISKIVISADGTPIYTEAKGNPFGPQLVLAHGLACTHTSFDPLFNDQNLLAALYMVRYDTRGHGLSGKPPSPTFYTSDRYASDLTAIITAYKLSKPFFAGWSLGGAIGADIAANFPQPLPFSGLIWLAGLPYLGDILPKVATPTVLSFLPGLQETNDSALALQTRINFVGTLSVSGSAVPFPTLESWVGATGYLPPTVTTLVLNRTQDSTALFRAGAAGWPLLILAGSKDQQINGSAVIDIMAPKFTNVESHLINGGGHIIFYDNTTVVSHYLLNFIQRVNSTNPYPVSSVSPIDFLANIIRP